MYTSWLTRCVLLPLVSYSYHIIPCMLPAWYHLLSLCLLLYACAHDMIFNTCSFDSDLLTHVCLSLHATWHSPYHSLGSFWLPWIFMFRSRSLKLVDLPVADQRCAAEAWIIGRPSRVLFFQAPWLAFEFFCCNSWTSFVLFIIVYLFIFSHLRLSVM